MKSNPSYYAIIPANVRYSDLKPSAKLLYGEITALENKKGYCYASNRYFAELYGVTKNTISLWVKDLYDKGFINVVVERDKNKQVIKRMLTTIKNNDSPTIKKDEVNNTSLNTTSNNIYIRDKFINEVMTYDYSKDMLEDFINYWCEGKKKMRFQKQDTFEIKLRLLRWAKNQKKFNKPNTPMSKIDGQINEWQKAKELL